MGGQGRLGYRPALDGVRGLAIAAVVSRHAFGWPQLGSLGVDLFFVLSGFLITTLLLEEHARHGRISITDFYARRARRLLPALFAMLVVYAASFVAVFAARGDLGQVGGRLLAVASSIGYVANVFRMEGGYVPDSLGHLWSLAQEEQFYVLWPLTLILFVRARPRLLTRVLVVAIACVAVERLVFMSAGSFVRVYLGPDTHSEPILVGCLFAVWFVRGRSRVSARTRAAASVASLTVLVGSGCLVYYGLHGSGLAPRAVLYGTPLLTAFALAAGVLIVDCAAGSSAVARVFSLRPLRFLGQISYSLYLWHVPVLVLLATPVGTGASIGARSAAAVALSLAAACASRYLIELPFLRGRARGIRRQSVEPTAEPALGPA